MTHGLQVMNSAGAVVFDSRTAGTGVVGSVAEVAVAATPTFTFPLFAGKTLKVVGSDGWGAFAVTVDYTLGYPRASCSPWGTPRVLVFFLV